MISKFSTIAKPFWKRNGRQLVVPLGVMAQRWTPNELRAWLRGREEVVKLLEKMEEARQEVEPLEAAVASHRACAREGTRPAMQPVCDRVPRPRRIAGAGRKVDQAARRARPETGSTGVRRLPLAGPNTPVRRLSLKAAESRARDMACGLVRQDGADRPGSRSAAPAQAEFILTTIAGLFQELDSHREFQKRIQGIDRDAERFTADVEALVARATPDLGSQLVAEQARELASRLRRAQADARQAAALLQQQEREANHLRWAEGQYEEARVCLQRSVRRRIARRSTSSRSRAAVAGRHTSREGPRRRKGRAHDRDCG